MKVLLVDDDRLIREDIKNFFDWQKEGFTIVAEASNGEDALRCMRAITPDIILTDISMPKINGVELIKLLKSTNFPGECIVMSNYNDFDYVKDAMKFGAFDYCLKYKITPESLLNLLNSAKESIINKTTTVINNSSNYNESEYIHALVTGRLSEAGATDSKEYQLIYLRHSPISSKQLIDQSKSQNEICIHITENEDVLVIKADNYSQARQLEKLRIRTMELAEQFPSTIISYSLSCTPAGHLNKRMEELRKNADRHFYSNYNIIQSDEDFSFASMIPSEKRHELEDKLINGVLGSKQKNCKMLLDEVFSYFISNNIRPKTVHIFLEDIMYKIKSIIDPVLAISLSDCLPDREEVKYITAEMLKKSMQNWIEANFYVSDDIDKPEVIHALYYIHANYMNKLTLQQVADYVGMSRNHFCTVFHRETGESFVAYLQKIKMEKAKELLRKGKYRIQEVSSMVGIDNSRYFCKIFREYVGCLPSEYKEKDI